MENGLELGPPNLGCISGGQLGASGSVFSAEVYPAPILPPALKALAGKGREPPPEDGPTSSEGLAGKLRQVTLLSPYQEEIGWRNLTRLLVFATDSALLSAGTRSQLNPGLPPRDSRCHLKNNLYDSSDDSVSALTAPWLPKA